MISFVVVGFRRIFGGYVVSNDFVRRRRWMFGAFVVYRWRAYAIRPYTLASMLFIACGHVGGVVDSLYAAWADTPIRPYTLASMLFIACGHVGDIVDSLYSAWADTPIRPYTLATLPIVVTLAALSFVVCGAGG